MTPAEPAFPLPGAGDTVVLVVPPTMVVEYRMLLHASRAYSDHLHYLRLARWLERRGARVHLVDCPLDPDAVISFRGSRRAGPHTVEPLDLGCGYQGLSRESLRRRLESIESVRQVWISSQFTFDREPIHETVRVVRQACPDALLLLGGVYPTLCPEDALSTGVDHIHRGLLLAVEDVSTARVDWRSLVMLGRGCPNRCSFCSSRHTENIRHHIRAPDDILADIEAEEARGAGVVLLYHANLFARSLLGDALVVLSGLADRDVSPILYNGLEPRTVTPRVAEILYRAGVPDVTIPLQTLSREIAKDWSRREGLRDWRRAIDTLLEAGFSADQISTDVIVGHPDQSFEEAVRTACWVWSQGVTPLLNPYAATPRTPDALRHGDRFASMGLEEQHYLLWAHADPRLPVREYANLVYLSRVLPWCVERALEGVDPDSVLAGLVRRYLDEYGFDTYQMDSSIPLPRVEKGHASHLSTPWELALDLARRGLAGHIDDAIAKRCIDIPATDPGYRRIAEDLDALGHRDRARAFSRSIPAWMARCSTTEQSCTHKI